MQRRTLLTGALGTALSNSTLARAQTAPELKVLTDFPGGSAWVEGIDVRTRTLRITPTPHRDRGWACWWYFRLTGVRPGETITLDVGTDGFAKPDRAFFSADRRTWKQTAPGVRQGNRIVYRQVVEGPEAWFAWGPPFVLQDARELVERAARTSPHAKAFELCKSREGRSVPALRVAQGEAPERFGVWIQARQHAWEAGSSWVCQGLIEWLVSTDPRAAELRKRAAVYLVPVMDVDNVERGAGGKSQKPRDHNRDWTDTPHWAEVQAAQKHLVALDSARLLDLFIDLHNPAPNDREPEFFLPPREVLTPRGLGNREAFLDCAREEMTGPLRYNGKKRETGAAYDPNWRQISASWVAQNSHSHVAAVCLETPWNTPNSTQAGYQQIGRELGLAIERYLRESPRGQQ
jgi:hypothetical protein